MERKNGKKWSERERKDGKEAIEMGKEVTEERNEGIEEIKKREVII